MKKYKVFCFFLCVGLICTPINTSAKEGLSWELVSDEDAIDTDEENPEEDDSSDQDNDEDDDDSSDKDNDEDIDDSSDQDNDEDMDDSSDQDNDEDDSDSSDRDNEKDDSDEDDEDDDDDDDDDDENRHTYPSGIIYPDSEIKEMISDKYGELKKAYAIEDKFKRTKTIDSIDSFILNFAGDPLAEKKIAFLGDSITAGTGGTLTPDGSGMNYTDFIANYTSAEIINLGHGGSPIQGKDDNDAVVYRYGDIPKDSDIIVIFAGINDLFEGSDSFGSLEHPERGTYCGDTLTTFRMIHKRHPDAEIHVVITYPNKMEDYKEYTGEAFQDYADVQIELAEEYGFNVINLYEEGFLDSHDSRVRNAFFKDDIHPDDLGSEVLGRHILVHLIKDYID